MTTTTGAYIRIVRASYGAGAHWLDVTDVLQRLVMGQGGLSLNAFGSGRSMNALFGSSLPQTVFFVFVFVFCVLPHPHSFCSSSWSPGSCSSLSPGSGWPSLLYTSETTAELKVWLGGAGDPLYGKRKRLEFTYEVVGQPKSLKLSEDRKVIAHSTHSLYCCGACRVAHTLLCRVSCVVSRGNNSSA